MSRRSRIIKGYCVLERAARLLGVTTAAIKKLVKAKKIDSVISPVDGRQVYSVSSIMHILAALGERPRLLGKEMVCDMSISEAMEKFGVAEWKIRLWIGVGLLAWRRESGSGRKFRISSLGMKFLTSLPNIKPPTCRGCGVSLGDGEKRCKDCLLKMKRVVSEISSRSKTYVNEYLKTHPCVGFEGPCPYGERDPVVLEFDHVRGKKSFEVGTGKNGAYGLERLKAEIEKCEVRCANCHRRKTNKDRKNQMKLKAGLEIEEEFYE